MTRNVCLGRKCCPKSSSCVCMHLALWTIATRVLLPCPPPLLVGWVDISATRSSLYHTEFRWLMQCDTPHFGLCTLLNLFTPCASGNMLHWRSELNTHTWKAPNLPTKGFIVLNSFWVGLLRSQVFHQLYPFDQMLSSCSGRSILYFPKDSFSLDLHLEQRKHKYRIPCYVPCPQNH